MRPKVKIDVMTPEEVELIHASSLEILQKAGFKIPNETILKLFADTGAAVDFENEVAKIPPGMVEDALKRAPRFDESAQTDEAPMSLSGVMPSEAHFVDYTTKTRRSGTLEDVVKGIALCNELPNIGMLMPMVFPQDAPRERADVICQLIEFACGKKASGTWIYSAQSAREILGMYDIMGDDVKGPPFYILEPISPLQFPRHGLEISLLFAEKGLPVFVGPMAQSGLTAPITPAGTIVIQNTENLATLVLLDLLGGLPLLCYGGAAHAPDMRTMVCSFGSPNNILMALGLLQMARYYGLAFACNMGLTDAMLPDFQGGFEKGAQMALAMTGGGYLASFGMQGIVGADQGASLEQLVIDDEWLGYLNYICDGMNVSRDTIGIETILQVGIGGNFLSEPHTSEYVRASYWRPGLFNRDSWDKWCEKGAKDILSLAHETVEDILRRHCPPQQLLGDDKLASLENLVGFPARQMLAGLPRT